MFYMCFACCCLVSIGVFGGFVIIVSFWFWMFAVLIVGVALLGLVGVWSWWLVIVWFKVV